MNILEGLIPGEDAPKQADASHLEKLFVFSLMWSIGALLELDDRKKVLFFSEIFHPLCFFFICHVTRNSTSILHWSTIGNFRVPVNLIIKARLSAKFLL